MLRSDQFSDVIEVIQHVLDCCRFITLDEHAHTRNAHDTACLSNLLNRFVSLQTRMIRHKRTTVRVCNQHRLLRDLESIERGAIAAMRHVDRHSDFIHSFNDRDAEVGDAFVTPFSRTIADQIARVVSELRNALAEGAKEIHIVRTTEVFGILQPENDADLA
jgi:hypothetical protein